METKIFTLSGIKAIGASGSIEYLKSAAPNFLYIFIAPDALGFFNETIRIKRGRQIEYIEHTAKMTSLSYADIRTVIVNSIRETYGMSPAELLLKLTEGKNLYSLVNIEPGNVNGIGKTVAINLTTGMPVDATQKQIQDKEYETIMNTETSKPISVVNNKTGAVVSTYDAETGTFKAGDRKSVV